MAVQRVSYTTYSLRSCRSIIWDCYSSKGSYPQQIEQIFDRNLEIVFSIRTIPSTKENSCTVNWGCRIYRLHLRRKVRPPRSISFLDMTLNYSNGKAPALEIWGIGSTRSLPLPPGPPWLGEVELIRVISIYMSNRTNCVQTNDWC